MSRRYSAFTCPFRQGPGGATGPSVTASTPAPRVRAVATSTGDERRFPRTSAAAVPHPLTPMSILVERTWARLRMHAGMTSLLAQATARGLAPLSPSLLGAVLPGRRRRRQEAFLALTVSHSISTNIVGARDTRRDAKIPAADPCEQHGPWSVDSLNRRRALWSSRSPTRLLVRLGPSAAASRSTRACHSPGGQSVEAASSVCASKPATRSLSLDRVPERVGSQHEAQGAGSWSTLAMIAAAMRAGSRVASPLAGSRMRSGPRAGVPS